MCSSGVEWICHFGNGLQLSCAVDNRLLWCNQLSQLLRSCIQVHCFLSELLLVRFLLLWCDLRWCVFAMPAFCNMSCPCVQVMTRGDETFVGVMVLSCVFLHTVAPVPVMLPCDAFVSVPFVLL